MREITFEIGNYFYRVIADEHTGKIIKYWKRHRYSIHEKKQRHHHLWKIYRLKKRFKQHNRG
jgi:hypothetical protein